MTRFRRLLVVACIATLAVSGCASKKTKTDDKATVEDRTGAGAAPGDEQHALDSQAGMSGAELPVDVSRAERVFYFDYDSSELKPEYGDDVQAHAAFLAKNPGRAVTLEGHADERGSREYNLGLGERRANTVRRQLVLLGASAEQIRAVSYGEERPLNEGHDEAAYALNRRVEIVY